VENKNILIIHGDKYGPATKSVSCAVKENTCLSSVVFREELGIVFTDFHAGHDVGIEAGMWDMIIVTKRVVDEIGEDAFSERWKPAILSHSKMFLIM